MTLDDIRLALIEMKRICISRENCKDCPLSSGMLESGCFLGEHIPLSWPSWWFEEIKDRGRLEL